WPHQTVPPGETLTSLMPSPLARLAFFDSRYLSAAIWSGSLCCSTLPESPLALAGCCALVLIESLSCSDMNTTSPHCCLFAGGGVFLRGMLKNEEKFFG